MIKLTLVLDNLRSCHNVGSIIRTANGFGHRHFVFLGTTPYPLIANDRRLEYQIKKQTQQIQKTSLGAEKEIIGQYFQTADDFLQQTRNPNLICLEQTEQSQLLSDYQPKEDNYLIFGNEINGISPLLLKKAATCLMIPMLGSKESFNVAITVGITLYQFNLHSTAPK